MLHVNDLTVYRGHRLVLDKADFVLGQGQKAGLVGVNGAGKTTLLKTITGLLKPDEGQINAPQRVGYLPQEVTSDIAFPSGGTVGDYVLSGLNGYQSMNRAMRRLLNQMENVTGSKLNHLITRYGELEAAFDQRGYYTAQHKAERLIAHLGLGNLALDREMCTLSGGQKTRLALARVLLAKPDLLLLDEPTNFLDVQVTGWFMDFLRHYAGTVLIVSHDLELLDHSIDKVLHLNEFTHKVEGYQGNYSAYVTQRTQQAETAQRTFTRKQREITRLRETAAQLKTVGRTKSSHRRGQAMLRRVARLEESLPKLIQDSREVRVNFPVRQRSGRIVLETHDLCKSYTRPVLANLDLLVERAETVIIVGLNGTGKTTLLKIIAELLEPDQGQVEWGYNVDLGYYAQEYELLDYERTMLEEIQTVSTEKEPRLRAMLGRFLFTGERVFQKVGSLSGGEKTRLALAKLVIRGHNVLLLDEPTTYLDPASQEILVSALQDYEGTLILVSHNVDFVSQLHPDTALIMPDGMSVPYQDDLLDLIELT